MGVACCCIGYIYVVIWGYMHGYMGDMVACCMVFLQSHHSDSSGSTLVFELGQLLARTGIP